MNLQEFKNQVFTEEVSNKINDLRSRTEDLIGRVSEVQKNNNDSNLNEVIVNLNKIKNFSFDGGISDLTEEDFIINEKEGEVDDDGHIIFTMITFDPEEYSKSIPNISIISNKIQVEIDAANDYLKKVERDVFNKKLYFSAARIAKNGELLGLSREQIEAEKNRLNSEEYKDSKISVKEFEASIAKGEQAAKTYRKDSIKNTQAVLYKSDVNLAVKRANLLILNAYKVSYISESSFDRAISKLTLLNLKIVNNINYLLTKPVLLKYKLLKLIKSI